ncbi:MAG: DUF721 domain-containing protein [Methylocapsa sp.]|nr:DUF721 domain-containing protein [Methylocapsa sp.]
MQYRSAKTPWPRPLGGLLQPAIGPLLAKRGFGQGALILYWDNIVGERLAAASRPVKIQPPSCPRGPQEGSARNGAALVVRVETGFALEMQHLAPLIIERANAHFGWQCIARLVLMQGPVDILPATRARGAPQPGESEMAAAASCAGDDLEEPLRQVLIRLGARIFAQSGGRPESR